jgi:peroxiredoxin (alkyl hydroperoxide reductase subunit C)
VVTVSRDTKFVHLAWQRDEGALAAVRYPMASDVTGEVAHLFGVIDHKSGFTLRGTYIISPEGTLLNAEINFFNLGRSIEEILRKVRANRHLAGNPSEGVPAQWKEEGDVTLKPGPKLVGNVAEAMKKKRSSRR